MLRDTPMTSVFVTAFQSLNMNEQRAILGALLKIKRLRNDLMDIAIAESRSQEKSRPFSAFLKELKK